MAFGVLGFGSDWRAIGGYREKELNGWAGLKTAAR